jgi:hypothetical protein
MAKAAFAEYDNVIQALGSDRSDHAFDICALPWRTWRWQHLFDSHDLRLLYEFMPEDAVPIGEQITRRAVPREMPLEAGSWGVWDYRISNLLIGNPIYQSTYLGLPKRITGVGISRKEYQSEAPANSKRGGLCDAHTGTNNPCLDSPSDPVCGSRLRAKCAALGPVDEPPESAAPFDMTVLNDLDRFHLVMDTIDGVPRTGGKGIYLKQQLKDKLIEHRQYVDKHGQDMPEIRNWKWSDGEDQKAMPLEERRVG